MALIFTLASSFFVTAFATLPRWGQQESALQRRDYCKWDCPWYSGIAELGYEAAPRQGSLVSWHFLPLFPITVAPAVHLLHIEPQRATVLMSKLFLFTAILAFLWMMGEELSGWEDRVVAAALVAFNPYLIYANAGYSEPLYFTMAACAFGALNRSRFVTAGFCGGLLSATRIQGVVFTLAYAIRCLRQFGIRHMLEERRLELLLGLLLCPLGVSLYTIYLYHLTGDALAPMHSFAAWGLQSANPFTLIADGLRSTQWHSYFAWTAVAGLILSAWLAYVREFEMAVFLAICILLPASAELAGMPRFFWWQPPTLYAVFRLLKRYPQLRTTYTLFVGGMAAITTYFWMLRAVWLI